MANGYLGEFPLDLAESPFKDHGPADWAMYFVRRYGQIEGGHHKAWVLDQVARILKGTPVVVKEARWTGGQKEHRVVTGDPSAEYLAWVEEMKGETDDAGDREYDYDPGIAP